MSEEHEDIGRSFEEAMRAIGQEISKAVERFAELDLDQYLDAVAQKLREQAETAAEHASPPSQPKQSARHGAEPHPLDVPSEEQGLALAALDSGRWKIEPGTDALTAAGDGPGPRDALGLVRELRVRDWLDADGGLTLAGRNALASWLDTASK